MNNTFAKVILGSRGINGAAELFTLHLRYPRIIHGEIMTHRVFSRNGRSSRAVPIRKMLKEVWNDPFIPWHWGENKSGMQAGKSIEGFKRKVCIFTWWLASRFVCMFVYILSLLNVHKQISNRILEPFSYIDLLVSSTEWDNFYELRIHGDAEPHFNDLAVKVRNAINEYRDLGKVQTLLIGQWHLPYIEPADTTRVINHYKDIHGLDYEPSEEDITEVLKKLSVARCARISYVPFNGQASVIREEARYHSLVGSRPIHSSPAEHQATPTLSLETNISGNFGFGWCQNRKIIEAELA